MRGLGVHLGGGCWLLPSLCPSALRALDGQRRGDVHDGALPGAQLLQQLTLPGAQLPQPGHLLAQLQEHFTHFHHTVVGGPPAPVPAAAAQHRPLSATEKVSLTEKSGAGNFPSVFQSSE